MLCALLCSNVLRQELTPSLLCSMASIREDRFSEEDIPLWLCAWFEADSSRYAASIYAFHHWPKRDCTSSPDNRRHSSDRSSALFVTLYNLLHTRPARLRLFVTSLRRILISHRAFARATTLMRICAVLSTSNVNRKTLSSSIVCAICKSPKCPWT